MASFMDYLIAVGEAVEWETLQPPQDSAEEVKSAKT